MRQVGHVVSMERGEVHAGFWFGKPEERGHLENLPTDGRIILK